MRQMSDQIARFARLEWGTEAATELSRLAEQRVRSRQDRTPARPESAPVVGIARAEVPASRRQQPLKGCDPCASVWGSL